MDSSDPSEEPGTGLCRLHVTERQGARTGAWTLVSRGTLVPARGPGTGIYSGLAKRRQAACPRRRAWPLPGRPGAKLRDHSKLHLLGMPGRCLPTRSLARPSPRPWPTEDGGRYIRRREGRVAKQIVAFSQTPTISPALQPRLGVARFSSVSTRHRHRAQVRRSVPKLPPCPRTPAQAPGPQAAPVAARLTTDSGSVILCDGSHHSATHDVRASRVG